MVQPSLTIATMAHQLRESDRARPSDHIVLNVGGVRFEMLRNTLTKYPDSMLAAMFSGRHAKPLPIDKDGVCFLDRSPMLFAVIVEYLRQSTPRALLCVC